MAHGFALGLPCLPLSLGLELTLELALQIGFLFLRFVLELAFLRFGFALGFTLGLVDSEALRFILAMYQCSAKTAGFSLIFDSSSWPNSPTSLAMVW